MSSVFSGARSALCRRSRIILPSVYTTVEQDTLLHIFSIFLYFYFPAQRRIKKFTPGAHEIDSILPKKLSISCFQHLLRFKRAFYYIYFYIFLFFAHSAETKH